MSSRTYYIKNTDATTSDNVTYIALAGTTYYFDEAFKRQAGVLDTDTTVLPHNSNGIKANNKDILKTSPIQLTDNDVVNDKDYQWNIRLYNTINPTDKPNTKVCDGFLTGSTKQVFWADIPNPDDPLNVGDRDYLQSTLDQIIYDRYIQLPLTGIIYNAKEEDDPPTTPTVPERKKIEWVDKKIGRNDPCPCGSGKKFKNCHGMNLPEYQHYAETVQSHSAEIEPTLCW